MFVPRKGNIVTYRDVLIENGALRRAIVTGHGRKNGQKIVFLSDGCWTYRHNLKSILSGRHDPAELE
jgi:hypothetical protein